MRTILITCTKELTTVVVVQDVIMFVQGGWNDFFYVEGAVYEQLDTVIGSSGDPRGIGSHYTFMLHDRDGNAIKVTHFSEIQLSDHDRSESIHPRTLKCYFYKKSLEIMQVKLWATNMWSTIEMLQAALADKATHPHGVVVKAFAFIREEYMGDVGLKSADQSQVHVCDASEIPTELMKVSLGCNRKIDCIYALIV